MRPAPLTLLVLSALLALSAAAHAAEVDGLASELAGGGGGFFSEGVVIGLAAGGTGLLALLGLLYFLGVGGLRHVDAGNVLEHPMRSQILDTVQDRPGVHLRELATVHDTAVTNTQWHLRKLEMAGLVRTQKVAGRRLYYPTSGGTHSRQAALENAATANPNAERVFQYIRDHSGCNQRSLCDALSINPGTVRWHLRRLQDAGLVRALPDGVQTRYFTTQRPPRPAVMRMEAPEIAG
jgi:predicted transcriptional regulator